MESKSATQPDRILFGRKGLPPLPYSVRGLRILVMDLLNEEVAYRFGVISSRPDFLEFAEHAQKRMPAFFDKQYEHLSDSALGFCWEVHRQITEEIKIPPEDLLFPLPADFVEKLSSELIETHVAIALGSGWPIGGAESFLRRAWRERMISVDGGVLDDGTFEYRTDWLLDGDAEPICQMAISGRGKNLELRRYVPGDAEPHVLTELGPDEVVGTHRAIEEWIRTWEPIPI